MILTIYSTKIRLEIDLARKVGVEVHCLVLARGMEKSHSDIIWFT